jgi:hypothetical protein
MEPKTCDDWMKFINNNNNIMKDDILLYTELLTRMHLVCQKEKEQQKLKLCTILKKSLSSHEEK